MFFPKAAPVLGWGITSSRFTYLVCPLDADMNSRLTCSTEHNLSGEARGHVSIDRKAHVRYGLENGALARGPVADHYDLGQIDKLGNPERPETVDSIEKRFRIGAVELGDNFRRKYRGIHLVLGRSEFLALGPASKP